MKIGVIEEVDEQMTMTSIRPESRPHVQSIFPQGPPPASAPVDVPGTVPLSHNGEILSSSAPAVASVARLVPTRTPRPTQSARSSAAFEPGSRFSSSPVLEADNVSIHSLSSSTTSDDEFSKLKTEREKQRKDRVLMKLARSISAQTQVGGQIGRLSSVEDSEALLAELANTSRISLRPTDRDDVGNNRNHI